GPRANRIREEGATKLSRDEIQVNYEQMTSQSFRKFRGLLRDTPRGRGGERARIAFRAEMATSAWRRERGPRFSTSWGPAAAARPSWTSLWGTARRSAAAASWSTSTSEAGSTISTVPAANG